MLIVWCLSFVPNVVKCLFLHSLIDAILLSTFMFINLFRVSNLRRTLLRCVCLYSQKMPFFCAHFKNYKTNQDENSRQYWNHENILFDAILWRQNKFKMADGRHIENRFLPEISSRSPISLKFCTVKQNGMVIEVTWHKNANLENLTTLYLRKKSATVSLVINTAWWTAIAHAHLASWAPESNLAVRVNRAIDDRPGIQQEAICYQWFKQRLILNVSKPSIRQRSQIKEDTVEPLCLPENLISKHTPLKPDTMIRPALASNPDSPITVTMQRVPRRYQQRHRGRPQ